MRLPREIDKSRKSSFKTDVQFLNGNCPEAEQIIGKMKEFQGEKDET
jgi:hypothetical protein